MLVLMAAPARGHELCAPAGSGSGSGWTFVPPPADDWDCDFVKDTVDNCPPLGYDDLTHRNPNQANSDNDPLGDWCDNDDDNDGVLDWTDGGYEYQPNRVRLDNCRTISNPPPPGETRQVDTNGNGVGDACEFDGDGDGVFDTEDNCRDRSNPDQQDTDGDRNGDACDNDLDGDFVRNSIDNCPLLTNPQVPPDWKQPDADGDGIGTACDPLEAEPTPAPTPTPVPSATPAPTPTPGPGPGGDVNDRQAPRVSTRLKSTQYRDEIEDGLVVRLSCSEACTVKTELVADKAVAKRLKLRRTSLVAAASAKVEAAGTTYAFVRISAGTRRELFKHKRTALTLRVAATDLSGNTRRVSERLTFAR